MAAKDTIAELKRVPLFSGLDRKELEMLGHLLKERRYQAGATMVEAGSAGHGLYVIIEGRALVRKDGRTVARLGPGDFFGEVAVQGCDNRTAESHAGWDQF